MLKMICFDMDGTIADLYGVPNWLEMLRVYSPAPFAIANPLLDMRDLADLLYAIRARGVEIRVITWLSKETNDEYDKKVAETKREWLQSYGLPIDHFHAIKYGATKADSVRKALPNGDTAILFDDIYPEELLLDTVKELIDKFAPRLILGISDEMSSTGNIERIKLVRDYVDAYNATCDKEGN